MVIQMNGCVSSRWVKLHPGLRHFLIWPSGLFSPTRSFDQNRRVFFFLSTLLFRHKHVNNRSPSKNVTKMFGLVWGTSLTERRDPFKNFFSPIERNRQKIFRWWKTFERDRGVRSSLFELLQMRRPPPSGIETLLCVVSQSPPKLSRCGRNKNSNIKK